MPGAFLQEQQHVYPQPQPQPQQLPNYIQPADPSVQWPYLGDQATVPSPMVNSSFSAQFQPPQDPHPLELPKEGFGNTALPTYQIPQVPKDQAKILERPVITNSLAESPLTQDTSDVSPNSHISYNSPQTSITDAHTRARSEPSPTTVTNLSNSRAGDFRSPTPSHSKMKMSLNYYMNTAEGGSRLSSSTVSSQASTATPLGSSHTTPEAQMTRSFKPSKVGDKTVMPLIPHFSNEPYYDPDRDLEYFDETKTGVYGRIFVLKQLHEQIEASFYDDDYFITMLMFGSGILAPHVPDSRSTFLTSRGEVMRRIGAALNNVNDENADLLLVTSSILVRMAIYVQDAGIRDQIVLSMGPSAVITKVLETPELFPKSLSIVKRYADGLQFTARFAYFPVYDARVLKQFLEVMDEFNEKFLKDEDLVDADDELHKQFEAIREYVAYVLHVTETEKSSNHTIMYPIRVMYEILQRWFLIVPTKMYAIGSHMPPVEKVFYNIVHSLSFVLEAIFFSFRYIFTALFNGYHDIFCMPKDVVLDGLSPELREIANYFCRIMAFLNRRRHFINRNTVLNDIIPSFTALEDRFKARPIEIHESCIIDFKNTVIKPYHYPSESVTSKTGDLTNYFKGKSSVNASTHEMFDMFSGLNYLEGKSNDDTVDLLNVNEKTGLLNNDFDPDPIFNEAVNYQECDVNFMKSYLEDRKLILTLDN